MAEESLIEGEEENILYDLLVITEWPPETDTQIRGNKEHNTSLVAKAVTGPFRLILHYLWYSPSSSSLPSGLIRLANKQINWQLVLASNGKLLAVVQDQCVEIRSVRDDFGSVIGKCQVPKDPNPQWRRVAWSHDCTLLAYADSTGTVRLFDLMGSELLVIPPVVSFPGDFSCAVAGLIFLEYTASAQWSAELLVITYGGALKSYLVSVGTNQNFQENHSFSFSAHYSHGITSAIYHPGHRLLLVGGCEGGGDSMSKALCCGITAWRALSGSPHYKQVTSYEDDISTNQKKGFFRIPSFRLFSRQADEKDGVFRMSLSPDGTLLAVIHFSGRLSLWDVPSLKQRATWSQDTQPGFEELNPEWKTSLERRKKIKDKEQYYPLMDVSWWSDNVLILARCSGSVTVSSVRTLCNLLGKSCEWFEPSPRVTAAHDGGFLSLECEVKLAHKRGRLESNLSGAGSEDEEGDDGGDSDSDEESSAKARYFSYIKQGLYYVTEMERFAPSRKRPRTVTKNYRLVSLRSTTPEELYQRKIDNEEYGEALSLAHAYNLDSDLVYQRQWRKSTVSIASIQDYLSKIRKRSWVLHECVERVPENVDAAKELLQYGLKGTDLEALIAIGNREDGGRFILPGDIDLDEIPYEDILSDDDELEKKKEKEIRKRRELLAKVDFSRLTLEQKELCRSRLKLLSYLDRLATYEEILGGPHAAEQKYDAEFFKKFRSQNIVLSARNYARESNVQALDILFTYHGAELLQHRLAILYNFPETTSPHEYTILLPEACVDDRGELLLIPWDEQRHREMDWCEAEECRAVLDQNLFDDDSFLYEESPDLVRFRTANPSVERLTDWYKSRAQDIDSCSRQVDCALSLVRLGKEREIPGLELLCDDLVTMETLVYETSCELSLTLKVLQQLDDIDKLRLLMKNSSTEHYVKDALQWMVPFLHRCEGQKEGAAKSLLREYLVSLAQQDLSLPLIIFQHSKPDCQQKIIGDPDQLMVVALECIYSCERDDQLSLCYDILECLPQRGYGPETDVTASLHDQVDKLEKHLSVVEVLEKHGLQKPISYVKNSQNSEEEAYQLMVKLCRHTGRKNPPVSETVWKGLLQDLLDMQQNVYTCQKPETCHQVFVESLLCSSRVENVRLAGQLMHCSKFSQDVPVSLSFRGKGYGLKVAYDSSVELVLAAAREYFNSSTTLTDPCMGLARVCLQLITDCPPAIQEELDLISALSQLEDFSVSILPLQVRLRSNRLSIIKECIAHCSTAYKQSTTLLNLASLLRMAGDDEATRKGQVLTLLAEQAFQCLDFKASYIHCQDLMAAGYSPAWEVCSLLGQFEAYGDLEARQELLAFSLTHCPPDNIHGLLAASSDLQTQVLYRAVNYQMEPVISQTGHETEETDSRKTRAPTIVSAVGSAGDLLHRTTAKTMEVLTTTGLNTKAVLTAVSDHRWWKESLNYLRPRHGHGVGASSQNGACENSNLERQGCNPFYQELIDDPYVDPSQDVYTSYKAVPQENFAEVLLRTGKLAEVKTEGKTLFPATEVLLQLANDAFPRDMMLALSYLLALPQVLDANRCFEKQCHSALSLQLAAYYYSLQIYSRLIPCFKDKNHTLYQADPKELIRLVTQHVSAYSDWPEELQNLINQLHLYNERLRDFTQAQVLQALGRGVDVQRFSSDSDYKKETILGLTETLDDDVYRIALSLANRYSVPLWEVYMTHLEFLFTDSGLSTKDIEARSESLGLFNTLKSDPQAFYSHMTKYVLPTVEGTDLARLLYYYTLLDAAGCEHYVTSTIKPDSHVKLLKKLRAVASGLDYRRLTDESLDPLATLQPVLTSQNVLSISKLANRLPLPGVEGATVSPSSVHAVWLQKLFWKGDPQLLKRPPQTDQDYLHAYDTCAKYFDRLMPADAVHFLDSITFSPDAAKHLSIQARLELIKRATKALRQLGEKSRKKGSDGGGEQEGKDPAGMTFEEALAHLQQSQAHLDTLNHAFIMSLKNSQQEQLQGYSQLYDLSRSERSKVHELAVTMATDGQPLERIGELLRVAVRPLDLSVKTVLRDAVERVVAALSGDPDALTNYPEPLRVLEAMVTAVHNNVQTGDRAVTSDDLLAWLRPFCGDASFPVRPRIDVLQILESNFSLRDNDVRLLLLYRTQAVLKDREVQIEDVENEEKRYALFLELLGAAQKWEDFPMLMLLLQAWPPMIKEDVAQTDRNSWVVLTSALLTHCQGSQVKSDLPQQVLTMVRSLYKTKHKLPSQCIRHIATLLLQNQPCLLQPALKLMAESGDEHLLQLTLDQINGMSAETASSCDAELLSLLLDAGLLVGCVSSALYPLLTSHMLSHQQEGGWDVEKAAAELLTAGHGPEAGSLLLAFRGTHQAQFTFNSALAVLKKWL
ncbi:Neuroblastoma-amplified sequence Neuroblastoma-amplified gene protein -like protein [Channa argus]|uniref:Neuroblastoma-amplified sequence Neuroblastoma-amplified gene protein-like protein n=1 Tax=Channa argus TaxID=215402 RepID=A0A6G1QKZ3_CHAAH|nr:Neuroblastoma-amplified sequence Neuroblastoma-amplified gene protein -like protein [Channa argus]